MPQVVIRNGKSYTEYTPQEIDAMRLESLIEHYRKRGQMKFASAHTDTIQHRPSKPKRHD